MEVTLDASIGNFMKDSTVESGSVENEFPLIWYPSNNKLRALHGLDGQAMDLQCILQGDW